MQQHKVVLALVPVVVLAGCIGGLGAEADPSQSAAVSPEEVPGVTNGTLSNASELLEANQNAVTTTGAIIQINQSSERRTVDARLVVGANISTHSLSATVRDNQATTIDQWSNETTQFVRMSTAEETNYHVRNGHDDRLTLLSSTEQFVSAGNFEVSNETTGDGTVILTADSTSDANTSPTDDAQFDGRIVVSEDGQIQNLSVTRMQDGEQVSYRYELRQAGVDSVPRPNWVDDVPPGATVQAQLSTDVANDSYLALEHTGGDVVPSGTTVQVESNGTTGTVSLNSSLSAGDTRYIYFDAPSQELQVSTDRPAQRSISPVTSPVSVRIVSEGGAVLQSGSMAWDSESASGSGSSSAAGDPEPSERTTGSTSATTDSTQTDEKGSQS